MGFKSILLFSFLISINLLAVSGINSNEQSNLETYIVHVELPDNQVLGTLGSSSKTALENWYRSYLPTTTADSSIEEASMIYPYHNVFKGFAARLSHEHLKAMEAMPGFISARPQEILPLHTTRSPNFLGLQQNFGFWDQSNYGKGVIIGVLDTGITPDHPSFNDEGMPPPPAKWKGTCQFSTTFSCNNKLIGARFFRDGNGSARDENGHGTHTASTAAGNFVRDANVFGNANGTAVGVAPRAHLAIYKVCTNNGCSESDILAAMDVAIEDGVDILSLSLGGSSRPFYADTVALGAFSAMKRGIFVSGSAGNRGPFLGSLSNEAPWMLTVGASSIDRKIRTTAILGNNLVLNGESLFQPIDFPPLFYPLFYDSKAPFCNSSSVTGIRGKIVLCEPGVISGIEKGQNVKAAGGVGMIIFNPQRFGYTTSADAHVLPATHLSYADGLKVLAYINSTQSPVASISFKGTIIGGDDRVPSVGWFSSRGPSRASPGILKPDIIGPGVNILAAWHESVENRNNTKSTFNVISGTSMACPHLSGVAALLKSAHPDWSPAAIKSAIMTTAYSVNLANNPIEDERLLPAGILAIGSGHVNPSRANNPGLIYDIGPSDYIPYLCGLNYTNRQVEIILQRRVNCTAESSMPEAQLNYPSFSIVFGSNVQTYTRTITNVGEANSSYTVQIVPPAGVTVTVKPNTLNFSLQNQKLRYEVTFNRLATAPNNTVSQGSLTWTSTKYSVRSPIVAIMRSAQVSSSVSHCSNFFVLLGHASM